MAETATKMKLGKISGRGREYLQDLTGLKAESIISVRKEEDGWHVLVELLEKKSIPDSMDILAAYDAILDDGGDLLEFKRKFMRKRTDIVNDED